MADQSVGIGCVARMLGSMVVPAPRTLELARQFHDFVLPSRTLAITEFSLFRASRSSILVTQPFNHSTTPLPLPTILATLDP